MRILAAIALATSLFAGAASPLQLNETKAPQRSIDSIASLHEFRSDLSRALAKGKYDVALPLALSYLEAYSFGDGNEKVDTVSAEKILLEGTAGGDLKSGYMLGRLYVNSKRIDDALDVLGPLLNSAPTYGTYGVTATFYGMIVLDHRASETLERQQAIQFLKRVDTPSMPATSRYILANLLNANNDVDEANKQLQLSCSSPNITQGLRSICEGNFREGGKPNAKKNCTTCDSADKLGF